MKYYIISGEASGDLHGSNLMKELYKQDTGAAIRFWGGDLMKQVGGTLVKHYKERAFMGFIEVLANLRKVLGLISFCKKDIADFNPDVIIFIDNSGFNLRIARWAKEAGFKTNYYISPQVWASRAGRVKDIKRDVDKMFVILPFEKEFYKQYGYEVNFVGHPLIDAIADRKQVDEQEFRREHGLGTKDIIVLLPGSRKQEIKKMLSIMLSLIDDFPKYQFVVAGAPSQPYEFYKEFLEGKEVKFVDNRTYDLLSIANTALVASGTATLETALFKVPQVVCYKGSSISYQIAKRIITLKYISLVNLIMDKEVVKELIQHDFTKENLRMELETILKGEERTRLFLEYYELEQRLGGKGASQKTAKLIIEG
ncbi:lipid-A-disaccharide synthase [Tenacibaculum maritimum]|uniref:lipid-A-disaccharide synthase n=1 Tax=Tenacibaculum maritimum TaxID=107401 RepID=UPI001E52BD74|nr:lipid-A-disaccharide synthase [Tenacibaculum maritimum]MCD9563507.1 lipid-A-disaccharide synthase [Tenacibaculum maritimum]MCD9564821.1 lipid-A-disaccharide synthase [Tenacibaculum maritimum]MCD9577600.1 lipid-A-disaccharide synthase [Tenacibaculum maritimum]MCD9595738.1 lipid-A-disaccharide synthase [Tenacibaculum maritimum]MCD9613081.1 lipid-A-disaccharide synthase [Tenacibaculum maritimum]